MSQHLSQTVSSVKIVKQPSFNEKDQFISNPNHSQLLPTLSAVHSYTHLHQKDLSLRSVGSNKRSQFSRISHKSAFTNEQTSSQISESAKSNYQAIQRILKNQNQNLKKQNELLLNEIQRLKMSNKKYKDNCLGQRIELQAVREECEAQKRRADEMKQIIMSRLVSLQQKALGNSEGLSQEERQDLMNALNQQDSS